MVKLPPQKEILSVVIRENLRGPSSFEWVGRIVFKWPALNLSYIIFNHYHWRNQNMLRKVSQIEYIYYFNALPIKIK